MNQESESEREKKIWAKRAKYYNNLKWTKNSNYLNQLVEVINPENHKILDIGTGTGKVAKALKDFDPSSKLIGIDISHEMLEIAKADTNGKIEFKEMDVLDLKFKDNDFDKVVGRMALHQLTKNMNLALEEICRVTKLGGEVVISEGIPPLSSVNSWYEEMFALKEVRKALSSNYIFELFRKNNLTSISQYYHIVNGFSVKNWLDNSGLDKEIQDKIYQIHLDAPEFVKEAYNMKITSEPDCLIDVIFLTTKGIKA